jgi:hypothetical protein
MKELTVQAEAWLAAHSEIIAEARAKQERKLWRWVTPTTLNQAGNPAATLQK